MNKRVYIFLIFFLTWWTPINATHLVGGEMSYTCLGNNNYEITLIIYRDCLAPGGAPFDQNAIISVYKQGGVLFSNDTVPFLNNIQQLPIVAPNNCTVLPKTVCTEKGSYKYTIHLPPTPGGYTITHQRCCRNSSITNVNNVNTIWGSTYTTSIPSMDIACNTNPSFTSDPPVVLCLNVNVKLDLSATEPDGDSIYYELCDIYHGGNNVNPNVNVAPNPAAPPPYTPVTFLNGFTSSNPIPGNPAFSIDHQTGLLTGTPTQIGQYVFAICAREYKNGVLISTNSRDFQFNVSPDCQATVSRIRLSNGKIVANPSPVFSRSAGVTICSGGTMSISNASANANSYYWDFGDPTTLSDTSRLSTPSYTYPDTGTYVVMLVVEPHTSCADTAYAKVAIYDLVQTKFNYSGNLCFAQHSIDFINQSNYSPNAKFTWDFGGNTNLGRTDTSEQPSNVVWDQLGAYYVQLTVDDFGCSGTYGETLYVYPNPIAYEIIDKVEACLPYTVQLFDSSYVFGKAQHFWDFGDGYLANDVNPIHTYTQPGVYTVTHSIRSLVGCLDSSWSIRKDIITVLPVPTSGLEITPREQSIYNPIFKLKDLSTNHQKTITYMPDDGMIENLTETSYIAKDTGTFPIIHVSFNEFGCTDTIFDSIVVISPFNLFMPNTFTPDGDGINDLYSYSLTGVSSSRFEVYNRWGELVFKSDDPYEKWNGRLHNHGPMLEAGIYSYVMNVDVKKGAYTYTKLGIINLVR